MNATELLNDFQQRFRLILAVSGKLSDFDTCNGVEEEKVKKIH